MDGNPFSQFKSGILLICLIILTSCAGVSREQEASFEDALRTGNLDLAEQILKGQGFLVEEKSRLLHLMELATIHHLRGRYKTSLVVLEKAHDLSQKLFTKSVSKKLATFLSSDNADNYYGRHFERSLIRYYQALNHYLIATQGFEEERLKDPLLHLKTSDLQAGKKTKAAINENIPKKELSDKEKRSHLLAARAAIVDWDSYLDRYRKQLAGSPVYKSDLAQMLVGSVIHKHIDTSSDRGIAKVLLKESRETLFKNYNLYPSFNNSFRLFIKNYKKLSGLKRKDIQSKYVSETEISKNLKALIDDLEKSLRKRTKKTEGEVTFVVNEKFVTRMSPYSVDIPIGFNTLTYNTFSKNDFISYVRKVLAFSGPGLPTISFELPTVVSGSNQNQLKLVIKNESSEAVKEVDLTIIHPVSDIAKRQLEAELPGLKGKVTARLMGKHTAALLASYATYRSMKKKGKEGMAFLVSSASYFIANRAIKASERADLRHWRTLPDNIRMGKAILPFGKYTVEVVDKITGAVKRLKGFSLSKDYKKLIYAQRLF